MKRLAIPVFIQCCTAVLAALPLFAATAFAQEASPCSRDMATYCKEVKPGEGRLLKCYEENKANMSADCQAWAEQAKRMGARVADYCSKEIESNCRIEKGDPLGMVECLQSNYVSLSPDCRVKLNEFKGSYPKPAR